MNDKLTRAEELSLARARAVLDQGGRGPEVTRDYPATVDWSFCAASLAEVKHATYMASEIVRHLKDGRGNEREAKEWLGRMVESANAALRAAGLASEVKG